jgi:hypothetical protein
MLITEILARNARVYGNEIALIERDPGKNTRKRLPGINLIQKQTALPMPL